MIDSSKARRGITTTRVVMLIVLCLCIYVQILAAQEQPSAGVIGSPQAAGISSPGTYRARVASQQAGGSAPVQIPLSLGWNGAPESADFATVAGPRRITLDEAQQQAGAANNPLARLAALGVEAAKQHRLGVQADFFPKISSTLANLHFNKFLGQVFEVRRPFLGTTTTITVPLLSKDQTYVAATVMQPLTPLFKLRQALTIARADERIARARAGMPLNEVASNVEQSYFELLVAQRQLKVAAANLNRVENRWRLASASAVPAGLAEHETEGIEANKAFVLAGSKVKEATVTLNALLGWPLQTELELVIPAQFRENVSADEAVAEALQNNPEVVEAEQTLVKARAASKLSKLDYVPDLVLVGGYAYQNAIPTLPTDFSYVGVMATYTLFDFGKREHGVKERNAQVAMAEAGVMLVKAKVAASATKAYLDLERSRRLSELAQRLNSASDVRDAGYDSEESEAARARIEAEMLQADLEHRLAFSRLRQLIGSSK